MKNYKVLTIVLIIVNIILIGVCVFFYIGQDRVAPKFSFSENNAIYNRDISEEKLLEGIEAIDAVDGEITDRIVIEKIVENEETKKAVVYYAVSDLSGNVSKISREFVATFPNKPKEIEEPEEEEAVEEIVEVPEESEEAEVEEEAEEEQTEEEEEDTNEAETTEVIAPVANASAPVLTLKSASTDVSVGQGIAWVNVIQTLKDDKDNYESLFGNIVVSKFDNSKAGSYPVTVYTVDSDGNKSNACALMVNVK